MCSHSMYGYSLPDWDLSAQVEQVSGLITHTLENMTEASISAKSGAISAIFPFAISLEQAGQQRMFDTVVHALQCIREHGGWACDTTERLAETLFEGPSGPSLNRAIALVSQYRSRGSWKESEVARWATAVLAVPYTEEVGRSVVDATLQIARFDSLRPHIPIGVWALLKEQPSLPPRCGARRMGTTPDVLSHIRGLGDVGILESYFLLVWSEWTFFSDDLTVMLISIREDFCGPGMREHREDLVQRLDHVLGELGRGQGTIIYSFGVSNSKFHIRSTKGQYKRLKDVLLEAERDAVMEPIPCASPRLTPFLR